MDNRRKIRGREAEAGAVTGVEDTREDRCGAFDGENEVFCGGCRGGGGLRCLEEEEE